MAIVIGRYKGTNIPITTYIFRIYLRKIFYWEYFFIVLTGFRGLHLIYIERH